ncbi:MAG: class I mannose-6-phosphate isomerase [Chlamydiae bacterium]|nr:class I mannose-6-phosphate isomerase [Chlamydiota bacterium]MBI3266358.1 class I mannose-6-phosphate isomerase [Chlamydiota bacterium]
MNKTLYPFKFIPLLKEKIWGGRNLEKILGRPLPPGQKIGESWEICDRSEDQTCVQNGPFQGQSLHELMNTLGEALLGNSFTKIPRRFPLLFKIIDAQEDLSLQVHPSDAYAELHEKGDPGKTEMWYVLESKKGAQNYCGLKKGISRDTFRKALNSKEIFKCLQIYPTQAGDVFFLPAGTVHALGKGNMVIEIQENSDLTYRLSDWGRVGSDGKPRALHLDQGIHVIEFKSSGKIPFYQKARSNQTWVQCPYFKVSEKKYIKEEAEEISPLFFQVWIILEGEGEIESESFQKGDFILIPAHAGKISVMPHISTRILKVLPGENLKK